MESATVGRQRDKRARSESASRPKTKTKTPRSASTDGRFGAGFEASWKVRKGRRRSARGCPRGLRGHRVHAYLSIELDPVFEGLDAELSPAAHRARLVVSSTRRDEIRAPADPPPHPRDAPLGLRLGGFSVTPLDDSRAPRARDERTLAKAPLATGPLRGCPRARGCALVVRARLFFQSRPGRIDRALLTRSSRIQLDRPRFADDRKTRRSRKTPRDGTSSMAPRRQNSPALQGPCARARRPDEPEPLADASKFEPRQWHLHPDPGVGGTTRRHPRREVPT